MKKNLFLLLSVYCFVIQPVLAGILRGEVNFYYFAGVNIVLIGMIAGLYFSVQTGEKTDVEKTIAETKKEEKKNEVVYAEEKTTEKVLVKDPVVKASPKKTPKKKSSFAKHGAGFLKFLIFAVSVVWIVITTLYLDQMFSLELSLLFALLSGYLWFWILSSLFVPKKTNLFFKIYRYLLLLGTLGMAGYVVYGDMQSPGSYINDIYSQTKNYVVKFLEKKQEPKGEVAKGEVLDVVLSTGSTVASGNTVTETGAQLSGNVLTGEKDPGVLNQPTDIDPGVKEVKEQKELSTEPLTMMQAIKHLFENYTISLDEKKTIKFKHISYDDEDYAYFKTAYKQRLIGKNSNPTALLSCDTYIVMKGLLEQWEVGKYSDILQAYWNKAKQLDKLNGCVQGEKVTEKTL